MFKKKTSTDTTQSTKKPFYKRTWFIVLVALCVLSAIFGGNDSTDDASTPSPSALTPTSSTPQASTPAYEIFDSSSYAKDSKECVAYRIEIAPDASEDEMRSVYSDLIDDDYYLHTVFFYELASDIDTVGSYTVGKLEEVSEGVAPEYTAPTLSAKDITALRDRASK